MHWSSTLNRFSEYHNIRIFSQTILPHSPIALQKIPDCSLCYSLKAFPIWSSLRSLIFNRHHSYQVFGICKFILCLLPKGVISSLRKHAARFDLGSRSLIAQAARSILSLALWDAYWHKVTAQLLKFSIKSIWKNITTEVHTLVSAFERHGRATANNVNGIVHHYFSFVTSRGIMQHTIVKSLKTL